jgi:hypothetical protein
MKHLKIIAAVLSAYSAIPLAQADSTLVYELTAADGSKVQQTIAIRGPWLRLESEPREKSAYTLMDTSRLMMFEVNDKDKNYQVIRMGRLYWPVTDLNAPKFRPITKKQTVSGVRCQPVDEIDKDDKSIAEHCMSAGGPLGLSAREMISLSRLFMSARRMGLGWPGVATPDERQVSILSHNPAGVKQEFKSVVHGPLAKTLFKIPDGYRRLKPDLPPGKPATDVQQQKPQSQVKPEIGITGAPE